MSTRHLGKWGWHIFRYLCAKHSFNPKAFRSSLAKCPLSCARNAAEANATPSMGLGCMSCVRIATRDVELDGSIPLEVHCLLPLGNKVRCARCEHSSAHDKCDMVFFRVFS